MRAHRLRVRTVLALVILAAVVPLVAFAAWLLSAAWREQVAVIERQNIDTARAVSTAIDQRVEGSIDALRTIAADPSLARGDAGAFQQRVAPVIPLQEWLCVVVVDPACRVVSNHAPLSAGIDLSAASAVVARVVAQRSPQVSDLMVDAANHNDYVFVAVPLVDGDALVAILVAQLGADSFAAVINSQKTPPNGVVTLIDRQPLIIARSRNADRFVGRSPSAGFARAAGQMVEGSWHDTLLEGTDAYCALCRSASTGWTVGVGVASEEIGPTRVHG